MTSPRDRRPSRLGAALREQGRLSADAARRVRPARLLMVAYGLVVAALVVVAAGVAPVLVQRVFTLDEASEEQIGVFFTAWIVTLLAHAALTYAAAIVLAYATAEVFTPRASRRTRLRGPRALVWRSLHRLGNATSITLVLAVAGSAIGLTLFGSALSTGADSPAELAAIQLGTLLFILTVALLYESVRVVVDLLGGLPALWRWASALAYPWIAATLAGALLPFAPTVLDVLGQWGFPATDEVELSVESDWVTRLVAIVVLWAVFLVRSGAAARLIRVIRGTRDGPHPEG